MRDHHIMGHTSHITSPGQQSSGVIERHQVGSSGSCHGVTSREGASSRSPGEPSSIQRMASSLPEDDKGLVLLTEIILMLPHLEKLSWVTRGDLLSWSMASWGEGAGKGRTRLGGLPGLI